MIFPDKPPIFQFPIPPLADRDKPGGAFQPLTPPPRPATNSCPCGEPGKHPQFMHSAAGPFSFWFCDRCAEINGYQNHLASQLGQAQPYQAALEGVVTP